MAEEETPALSRRNRHRRSTLHDYSIDVATEARDALLSTRVFKPAMVDKICCNFGFCSESNKITLKPGEVLFEADSPCETVWFIAKGTCHVLSGACATESVIPTGAVVGERHCIAGWTPFKRTVVAAGDEPVVVYPLFTKHYFETFLEVDPDTFRFVALYRTVDPDHLGLDKEQLGNYLASSSLGRPSAAELTTMFETLDSDKTGRVNLHDILKTLDHTEEEIGTSVLFARLVNQCLFISHFEDLVLERQFRQWYGFSNARFFSEGLVLLTVLIMLSFLVNIVSEEEPTAIVSRILALTLGLFPLSAGMLYATHFSKSGFELVKKHFDLISVLVSLIAVSLWLTIEDATNLEGSSCIALFKLPVYILGFSKMRLRRAFGVFIAVLTSYQIYLVFSGRLRPDPFNYVVGFMDLGYPSSTSFSSCIMYLSCVACLLSSCGEAERRARHGFLVIQDLINEDKRSLQSAVKSTASLLNASKGLSQVSRKVVKKQKSVFHRAIQLLVIGEEDDFNAENDETVNELSNQLDSLVDLDINFWSASFKDEDKEMHFLIGRVDKYKKMLYNKSFWLACCGCASAANFAYGQYFGDNQVSRWGSQILCFVMPFVCLMAMIRSSLTQMRLIWATVTINAVHFLLTTEVMLFHFYYSLTGDYDISAGCTTKITFLLYITGILVVNSISIFTFLQKCVLVAFHVCLFTVGVSPLFKYNAFYSSINNTCYVCSGPKWNQHDPRRGLQITPADTAIVFIFVIIGGSLNSHKGEWQQRQVFAGVLQRQAESALQAVKAKRISRKASDFCEGAQRQLSDQALVAASISGKSAAGRK